MANLTIKIDDSSGSPKPKGPPTAADALEGMTGKLAKVLDTAADVLSRLGLGGVGGRLLPG